MINLKIQIIFFFIVLIFIGRMISSIPRKYSKHSRRDFKSIFNDYTALVISIIPIFGTSLPIIEFYIYRVNINLFLVILGAIIITTGIILNTLANKKINKNWSPIIKKNNQQQLVKTGIYSIIRHPLYLSGLLIIIGVCVYFQAICSSSLIIVYFIIIIWRINHEERELVQIFKNNYLEYMKNTKKIIPFIY